jgi:hypothetical protein
VNDLCVVCVSLLSYLTAERCGDNVSNHPQCFVNDLTVDSQAPAVVQCSSFWFTTVKLVHYCVVRANPRRQLHCIVATTPFPATSLLTPLMFARGYRCWERTACAHGASSPSWTPPTIRTTPTCPSTCNATYRGGPL